MSAVLEVCIFFWQVFFQSFILFLHLSDSGLQAELFQTWHPLPLQEVFEH